MLSIVAPLGIGYPSDLKLESRILSCSSISKFLYFFRHKDTLKTWLNIFGLNFRFRKFLANFLLLDMIEVNLIDECLLPSVFLGYPLPCCGRIGIRALFEDLHLRVLDLKVLLDAAFDEEGSWQLISYAYPTRHTIVRSREKFNFDTPGLHSLNNPVNLVWFS